MSINPRRCNRPVFALLTGLLLLGRAAWADGLFGTNLLVNADAEAGLGSASGFEVVPVPGWQTVGNFTAVSYEADNGFPGLHDPGPAQRGTNYFAGGPENDSSRAWQLLDLSPAAAVIDAAQTMAELRGFLGGYASQNDWAKFSVDFLDAAGGSLGSLMVGGVDAAARGATTGLLSRSARGPVPPGTRSVRATLEMTRTEGNYNDGYADNLSLVLCPGTDPLPPLTIAPAGTNVLLFWPATVCGVVLEQAAGTTAATTWTEVSPPAEIQGTNYWLVTPATNACGFFRLRRG